MNTYYVNDFYEKELCPVNSPSGNQRTCSYNRTEHLCSTGRY